MFRVLFAVSLFQIILCLPLDNDLKLPDDVEIIPLELHGHHSPNTSEKIAIETGESIKNNNDDKSKTVATQTINHKDVEVGTIEEPIEGKEEPIQYKEEPIQYKEEPIEDKEEPIDHIEESSESDEEPIEHKEKPIAHEEDIINNKEEPVEPKHSTPLCSEEAGGIENTEKCKDEPPETGLKPDEEVVLLNKTIRLNSTTLNDGKFTVVLHFEVNGKDQISIKDANIIEDENPADDKADNKSDHTEHFSCPIHGKGKFNVAALYGCGGIQHKCIKQESTEDEHIADNEENHDSTVRFNGPVEAQGKVTIGAHYGCGGIHYNERSSTDKDLADNEKEDDDYVHVSGPVHAHGKVSIGAHYGCGGTTCYPYPFIYAQHFTHPPSYFNNYYEYTDSFDDEYYGDDHHQFEFVKGPSGTYKLHNHLDDSQEDGDDDDSGCVVCGRVPAHGSVKIAAKF